jgi:hypothetical protein
MYCICCKKNNVEPESWRDGTSDSEEDVLYFKKERKDKSTLNINNEMVHNGIIQVIDAGYGSNRDGDQFIIAICDDCIKENVEDGTLLYYGNYMWQDEEFVEEERENSKKIFRRRKNLDGLV